jgi:FixJ family two-component response regulator
MSVCASRSGRGSQCAVLALTAREREVVQHVVRGRLNKQIAADLGTVEKTIKVHRASAMHKLHARTLVDLVKIMWRMQG